MINRFFEQSPQRLVLVVDDDEDIREMLRLILLQCGYAVATAGSTEEAESYLCIAEPSVVVMDYLIPNANCGVRLAKSAHQRSPAAAKILMTCVPDAERIAAGLGIEYSMQKPFDPEFFLSKVREAVAEKFPD